MFSIIGYIVGYILTGMVTGIVWFKVNPKDRESVPPLFVVVVFPLFWVVAFFWSIGKVLTAFGEVLDKINTTVGEVFNMVLREPEIQDEHKPSAKKYVHVDERLVTEGKQRLLTFLAAYYQMTDMSSLVEKAKQCNDSEEMWQAVFRPGIDAFYKKFTLVDKSH